MIHRKLQAVFITLLLITACQPSTAERTFPVESTQEEVVASPTATPEPIPSETVAPPSPTPDYSPTPDTRLTSHYWREWPVVPTLSDYAQTILANLLQEGKLDPHTFSKVGDCQMTSDTFLGGYALGKYPIPDGHEATVEWFSISMTSESVTAEKGLGISSVLNPMFGFGAGYKQCKRNESPIDCELRTRKPAVVLIGMGTNWIPNAEVKFDQYLREVVDTIINTGALPILATKADNVEEDWMLNETIVQVAYEYDLPLVNVWRSVQDLPGRGIERKIYLTPDGWLRRNEAWLKTLSLVQAEFNK
jgi:hypothetical protein